YVCRLIAQTRGFRIDEVSLFENGVLNTLTEGLAPARVNPRRYVPPSENLLPARACFGEDLSVGAIRLSPLERHIGAGIGPIIKRERTQKDVVLELLESLHDPSRHSADGKDRYEQIALYAEQVIDDARIEIDIHVHSVTRIGRHRRDDCLQDLEPLRLAQFL